MRPAWLEIDLGAVRGNFRALKEAVGPECEVTPIVKANAYGHGLVEVTRALEREGAARVGVALLEEGAALRDAGVRCGILVLGATLPEQAEEALQYGLTLSVCRQEVAEALSKAAATLDTEARAEMKVDTGMGRLGVKPEKAGELLDHCLSLPALRVEAVWSHLATADEEDQGYAEVQFGLFQPCLKLKKTAKWLRFHLCNSAGVVRYPKMWLDAVRPGLLTYGLKPAPKEEVKLDYRPAMALKSRLNFVKSVKSGETLSYGRTFVASGDMVVGTIPVGYADGYPRGLSNRGEILFRGQRVPVVGRVCMDQFLVDLTRLPDAQIGEEVVLIGQQRNAEITANEVAERADTIVNEIVCRMGERLPRTYKR